MTTATASVNSLSPDELDFIDMFMGSSSEPYVEASFPAAEANHLQEPANISDDSFLEIEEPAITEASVKAPENTSSSNTSSYKEMNFLDGIVDAVEPAPAIAPVLVPSPAPVLVPSPAPVLVPSPAPVAEQPLQPVVESSVVPFPAHVANATPQAVPEPTQEPEKPFTLTPSKPTPLKKTARKGVMTALEPDPRFKTQSSDITVLSEVILNATDAEVVVDLETTALTPWNNPLIPSQDAFIGDTGIKLRYYDGKKDVRPRPRIVSVSVPSAGYSAAFDLDAYTKAEQYELVEALSGCVWVGHNLQFDYQWLLHINPDVRPSRIIDTMLLVTACRPQADVEMQGFLAKFKHNRGKHKLPNPVCLDALEKMVSMRAAAEKRNTNDEDGGAMPLQALSLWLLDEEMNKAYQKPHNWMLDTMTEGHYDYVMGDVTAPRTIARKLLNLPADASFDALLAAIDANAGGPAYKTYEQAIHRLVRMQQKGVRWDTEVADALDATLKAEAQAAADNLVKVAPELKVPLKVSSKPKKSDPNPDPTEVNILSILLNPDKSPTAPVKDALAKAIQRETGRSVQVSDAGNPVLDAKTLAYDFPDSKVVKYLAETNGPTKARQMLAKFTRESGDDSRLHPIVGIKAKTGRTSAQEPSLQQVPRDARFRAVFRAAMGYKIIATDFASIELRIAAALGVRAWRDLKALLEWTKLSNKERGNHKDKKRMGSMYSNVQWLLCYKEQSEQDAWSEWVPDKLVMDWLSDDTLTEGPEKYQCVERPSIGAPISHYRDYKLCQLFGWVSSIRKACGGDEAKLPFRAAYVEGIDPHLLTAVAMESQGGRLDLSGLSVMDYMRRADQKALKHSMKGPRQAAKAVNFGALYGQQSDGLHRQGVTAYGLSWTPEDAIQARTAWFKLYPEIGLWHWLLAECYKQKRDILDPYNLSSFRLADDKESGAGKVYWGSTLSGRKTVSPKLTSAANHQDQSTGAEIALDALANLPDDVAPYLVNFVHDELVLEVPDNLVPYVQEQVEKTMIASADKYLLPYGVPTEVESSIGNCWIH